jgi:hypothetical protein
MKHIVWTFLVIEILLILYRVIWLGINKYPRTMTYKSWEDALGTLIHMGIVVWIIVVLFR